MRFLTLLAAAMLGIGAWAAKKSPQEIYSEYRAKSLTENPLKLTDFSYKKLTTGARDYSVAVLLTALDPRFGCQLCHDFQPEWDLVVSSWTKGDKADESRLLYGTLDFTDGRDVFVSLGLQTAPVLMLFPPTSGRHAVTKPEYYRFDFAGGPQTAEFVHSWIAKHLPDRPHPPIRRPINWMRGIVTTVIVLGIFTAIIVLWPYLYHVVASRRVWGAFTLISILLFTGGIMFNQIRHVPYAAADGKGRVSYITPGFQNQVGIETQIIAATYGALAFLSISLVTRVPYMTTPTSQRVAAVGFCGGILLIYSFLLTIFKIKNPAYPFSLIPF